MKYFVVSDVHGCLKELKKALDEAGFDKDNENHTLISLGDNFDRGGLSCGVYKFLTHLPRVICLKGNHELILQNVFKKGYLDQLDISNGTAATIASFAGIPKSQATFDNELGVGAASIYPGLVKWLKGLPYYFKTKHYIFTHGWVPKDYYRDSKNLSLFTAADWDEATWSNTQDMIQTHRKVIALHPSYKNKTIVVGHWHTFRLRQALNGQQFEVTRKNKEIFDIWEDKENKIICIDGCTPFSKIVNVLVVED